MTFKQFEAWCNQRACDACWGMLEAMTCIDIIGKVQYTICMQAGIYIPDEFIEDVAVALSIVEK